jgi:hypothetical protein
MFTNAMLIWLTAGGSDFNAVAKFRSIPKNSVRHRRAQSTSCCPGETQAPADLTEVAAVQKPKTRRVSGDRAALGITQKEAYYRAASLGGGTGVSALLTGDKVRTDPQVA